MLCKAKTLAGYELNSLDGEIGRVKEFYFDDKYWTIRYLVASTGTWLPGRAVLISPYALRTVSENSETVSVQLTKKQIEDSPSLDSDKPVSQQFEETYHDYYGWPMYWGGSYMWGNYPYLVFDHEPLTDAHPHKSHWNPHLRSTKAVLGYHIQGTDGEIGHVTDYIIDDQNWAIRYLVVDTRNWWPGKMILISAKWIESVSWDASKVFVNLTCEDIKNSPEFTEETMLRRQYEEDLHQHYKRKGYWLDESFGEIEVPRSNAALY
jgi:uncharacterized protein YrrD